METGVTLHLQATMVVATGQQTDQFGYLNLELVKRRERSQAFDLNAPIQEQLSAVNTFAAESLVAKCALPSNTLRSLLTADYSVVDQLLMRCCNVDKSLFSEELEEAHECLRAETYYSGGSEGEEAQFFDPLEPGDELSPNMRHDLQRVATLYREPTV